MIVLAAIYSLTALKNRLREGLRRLGQPRYALGLLALLVYLAMIFGPSLYFGRPGGARATPVPRGPEIGIGVYVAVLWTLWRSGKTPAVNMQRSELMFLVTAPVTRRQVLLFWIVNHQPRLLLSGLGVAVFGWLWHWDPISTWVACWAVLNAWMALTLVGHQVCAHALWHGRPALGRGAFWGGLAALAGVVGLTVRHLPRASCDGIAFTHGLASAEPLATLLHVGSAMRLLFTEGPSTTLPWSGVLLALAAAAYGACCVRPAPFEEASLAQAEGLEVLKTQGFLAWRRHRRAGATAGHNDAPLQPFVLSSQGNPARAMTWKTLISVGRSHRPRVLLTALGLSLVGALAVLRFAPQAALHVAGLAVYGLVLGWMFVGTRLDLRQELGQFAVLKSYPLSGRHVLRGSTLALSLVLSSYALIVMTALVVLSARFPGVVQHWSVRAPLALAILVLSFAASYAMITIGNVLVVMWPAWAIKTLPKDAGFTQVGANLLALLLRMLPFIALWIVPGLVGAFIYFGSVTWLTLAWPWAILCAAPPAAAIVVTEALILLWLAERAYTRLDVSEL